MEDRERILLGAILDSVEGAIDDRLGDRLLTLEHQVVHELRQHDIAEFRIRIDFAADGTVTS